MVSCANREHCVWKSGIKTLRWRLFNDLKCVKWDILCPCQPRASTWTFSPLTLSRVVAVVVLMTRCTARDGVNIKEVCFPQSDSEGRETGQQHPNIAVCFLFFSPQYLSAVTVRALPPS